MVAGDLLADGLEPVGEGAASDLGVGVAQDDFVEDAHDVVDTLDEKHAHGVDVEINGPDEGLEGIKIDGAKMESGIKSVRHAMMAGADEFAAEFLAEGFGI